MFYTFDEGKQIFRVCLLSINTRPSFQYHGRYHPLDDIQCLAFA